MIEVQNLHKSFGEAHILKGISTSFEKGKTNLINPISTLSYLTKRHKSYGVSIEPKTFGKKMNCRIKKSDGKLFPVFFDEF